MQHERVLHHEQRIVERDGIGVQDGKLRGDDRVREEFRDLLFRVGKGRDAPHLIPRLREGAAQRIAGSGIGIGDQDFHVRNMDFSTRPARLISCRTA